MTLPQIKGAYIGSINVAKVDHKKDKTEIVTRYMSIGLPDDSEIRDPVDENLNGKPETGFSMVGKIRAVSVEAARNRLSEIRKTSQKLIGLNNTVSQMCGDQDERLNALDNVFLNSNDPEKVYSLSLYNKTKYYQKLIDNQNKSIQNVAKTILEA